MCRLTLAATGCGWSEEIRRRVENRVGKAGLVHVSTVAFTLHDYLNENLAWILLGLGFLAVAALWIILGTPYLIIPSKKVRGHATYLA